VENISLKRLTNFCRRLKNKIKEGEDVVKRMMITFSLVALILVGCSQKVDETGNQSENNNKDVEVEKVEEVTKVLKADSANFHFIVDWLTDTKIAFVEKDADKYLLRTFDIKTGEIDTLFEDTMIIVDVLIHPMKNTYLLHTTDNPTSATIKVISLEGVVLDEISIASSELAIEWNDMDPSLLLLTAFQKDWTFDVYLYNGEEEALNIMALEDPFPKWFGKQEIITVNVPEHPLDGGELLLYDYVSGNEESLGMPGVVYFDTNEERLLTAQINEENVDYKITLQDGTLLSSWTMPAVSNYSEWVFPELSWIADTTVFMPSATEGGQLDELGEPFQFVRVENGQQNVLLDSIPAGILRCSPNGELCLAGYKAEKLIETTKKKETTWLIESE